MINLFYMNDWNEKPEIVRNCEAQNHVLTSSNVGRCVTRYECKICDYEYKIDSGD